MNLLDLALGPGFVTFYCGGIVAVAGFFVLRLFWQAVSLHRRLGDVQGQLDVLPGKEGLASGFESYDTHVKAAIGLPWTEFVETLVLPEPGSGDPIRNASDVSQYLNDATVIFPRISSGFYQSMPNLLTGAGILGTFIGLAGGVGAASAGLSSGNPGEITASLQRLLDGASLAFLTSIVGISCSMLFVIVERVASRRLHLSLDRWVGAIESRLKRVTPEGVALEQLDQARRATKQLESFNTNLVFAIEQALEEKIAGKLSPQLDRLVTAVEGLRGDRATDAGKMIEKALGRFTDELQARAGSQFDEMASTVSDLNRTLKEASTGLGAAAENLEQSSRQNQQALAGMNRFVEEINTLRGTIEAAHRQIADIASPIEKAAHDIRVASDKTADTLTRTNELVSQLEQHQQEIAAAWNGYQKRFEGIDSSLKEVFSQLDDGLSGYCNQVKDFANELDRTTAKTTEALAGATAGLAESIETLIEALQQTIPRNLTSAGPSR